MAAEGKKRGSGEWRMVDCELEERGSEGDQRDLKRRLDALVPVR